MYGRSAVNSYHGKRREYETIHPRVYVRPGPLRNDEVVIGLPFLSPFGPSCSSLRAVWDFAPAAGTAEGFAAWDK